MALDKHLSVPEDHRMPRRKVHFPTDSVIAVSREAVLDSAGFLALEHGLVNKAQPALVSVDGANPQHGFRLSDDRVVVVTPFDRTVILKDGSIDSSRATFPMASPNGKHVYMDVEQARQAVAHGAFRNALLSAHFNAGYNRVDLPTPNPVLDPYFRTSERA